MFTKIDSFCREKMAAHIGTTHPEFVKTRTKLTGALSGCDVYAWQADGSKTAWIIFGGDKKGDRDIIADIAWTRSGKKLLDLDYIDWRKVPTSYPDDGVCKLVHKAVIGDDIDGARYLEIAAPPKELQELALKKYSTSELFIRTVRSRLASIVKKNPDMPRGEAEAKALEDNTTGSRPFFKLWQQCGESIDLNESELAPIIHPAMEKVFYLLDKYGFSFLQQRLK